MANLCRKGRQIISRQHQAVLWFAGLRGAIAFALSENMPGPHKEVYATATLSICIFTTVVCGGFTERILSIFGMREDTLPEISDDGDDWHLNRLTFKPEAPRKRETPRELQRRKLREGIKGLWYRFDDRILKPHFGGDGVSSHSHHASLGGNRGHYEMGPLTPNGENGHHLEVDGSNNSEGDDDTKGLLG